MARNYGKLQVLEKDGPVEAVMLPEAGVLYWNGLKITVQRAEEIVNTLSVFTVAVRGTVFLRGRKTADTVRLSGGTKSLKKLFIDRKIPAFQRQRIPVVSDDGGVLGGYGIGVNLDRIPAQLPAVQIRIEPLET